MSGKRDDENKLAVQNFKKNIFSNAALTRIYLCVGCQYFSSISKPEKLRYLDSKIWIRINDNCISMILVSSNEISESTAQGGFHRICLTALKFKMI
jgi:hypothetical protein